MNATTKRKFLTLLAFCAAVLFASAILYARAGGAGGDSGGGGSHSSSGGDGGDILILLYYLFLLFMWIWQTFPFPVNLLIILGIIAGIVLVIFKGKKSYQESSVLNNLPTGLSPKKAKGFDAFLETNPSFNEFEFKDKVATAFMQIQQAWMDQDLSSVRKFISDGVYQRFNTQFKMMELLQQKNILSNIEVKNIYIDAAETDGAFDILHVGIFASMNDTFTCELDPSMNVSGDAEFVEYWSFIRRKGITGKNIYASNQCPSCGAEQKGLGEIGKCAYCGTMINSGEYDWILSEITQSDDYATANPKAQKSRNLGANIKTLIGENADFAVQQIEDKASNGFLQILTARAYCDPSIMRRFVSDALYKDVAPSLKKGDALAYNRLFLNDVTLIGVRSDDTKNYLSIAVKYTYQRISIEGKKVEPIDAVMITSTEIVIMTRDKDAKASKGSIYAHICPSCGGTLKDSTDIKCQYCGNVLNSSKNEWIIDNILSPEEYKKTVMAEQKGQFEFSVDPDMLDSMYDVRDFALNNVMVMMTADGVYTEEEQKFFEALAKKWGYSVTKIQGLFMMGQNNMLSIKMPDKQKDRRKIFTLMEKAAAADGTIAPQEQAILDQIKKAYLTQKQAS